MQNVAKELDGAGVGYAANLLRRLSTTGAMHGKRMAPAPAGFAGWTLLNEHIVKTHWLFHSHSMLSSSNTDASENTTA